LPAETNAFCPVAMLVTVAVPRLVSLALDGERRGDGVRRCDLPDSDEPDRNDDLTGTATRARDGLGHHGYAVSETV
jgi:hypothetical protein